ncbi:MAG: response regulator transcription factor [Pseudomonadota bacterium]
MTKATVLIADDHPIFRQGVRHLVGQNDDWTVVAEANDGQSAIQLIRLHQPDIVILDLFMPNIDGLGVLQWARDNSPTALCVILTMQTDAALIDRAIELGARGYLFKEDAYDQLHHCLEAVMAGQTYTSPSLASPAILQSPIESEALAHLSQLTRTQLTLLQFLGEFKTSREIAELMNISHRTVQNHRLNICSILDVQGSGKLLEFAVRHQAEVKHLLNGA